MVKIKICGITNFDDAHAAIEAGADMLGFNFYRPSPRFIEPIQARRIIEKLAPRIATVGVFVNEPSTEDVIRIAREAGVSAIQLHGDESPEFCSAVKAQSREATKDSFVIKVFRVGEHFTPANGASYKVDAFMLDAFDKKLFGGTGRVIDWSIARRVRELVPKLFLSGGLSPENVANAIAKVQPYAVDACSALESASGRKDAERVRAFVRAVRSG